MRQYSVYPTLLDSFDWWRSQVPGARADQAFRELMDKLNKRPFKATPEMERGTAFNEAVDHVIKSDTRLPIPESDEVSFKGYTFSKDLVLDIARRVRGSLIQKYLQSRLILGPDTMVRVYGFADYVGPSQIWELKTGRYYPGKFKRRWQRHTYMACHLVPKFTYLVTDFTNVYEETYEDPGLPALKEALGDFIEFIEANRPAINNPKLFGG